MIEIIYNDTGEKGASVTVKPPKNIRQMGNPRGRHKIYIEDYVYTFLHSANFENMIQKRAAILLGKSEVSQDIRYTFISGAVSCDDFIFQGDKIVFDESCWEYIYKEIKQYFDNQEIVGWFLGMSGFPLEITPTMASAHRKYFTGRDKLLHLSEPTEGEDIFYAYEQGVLQKKEGYYVYYEKNLAMQEYMVCMKERADEQEAENDDPFKLESKSDESALEKSPIIKQHGEIEIIKMPEITKKAEVKQEKSEPMEMTPLPDTYNQNEPLVQLEPESLSEVKIKKSRPQKEDTKEVDEALQSYRSVLLEKKNNPVQKKINIFLYTAASIAMVVMCVIGITTLNNYEKMKKVEETLSLISSNSSAEGDTDKVPAQSEELVVESVPGEVESAKNNAPATTDAAKQQPAADAEVSPDQQPATTATVPPEQQTEPAVPADNQQIAQPQQEEPQQEEVDKSEKKDNTVQKAKKSEPVVETSAQEYIKQGYYVVKVGDRLEAICRKIYQTTAMLDKLCEANGIEDVNKIFVGQKIILP
jgi:hypothetical protein